MTSQQNFRLEGWGLDDKGYQAVSPERPPPLEKTPPFFFGISKLKFLFDSTHVKHQV